MVVIYIDVLFIINLAVNYLLLLITARFSGVFSGRLRLLLGAAIGAIFAVFLYFEEYPLLAAIGIRTLLCISVAAVAFGKIQKNTLPRLCLTFLIFSFVFAGAVVALAAVASPNGFLMVKNGIPYVSVSLKILLAALILAYCALSLIMGGGELNLLRRTAEITVMLGAKTISFRALLDTGNLLRDPVSGKKVIMISIIKALQLFDGETAATLSKLSDGDAVSCFQLLVKSSSGKFMLIPYQSTDENASMTIAVKPDSITINGKENSKYLLGFSRTAIQTSDGCNAIMGA